MDSKSTLQYLLSFFILLANAECNFGYSRKYDDALREVDCHRRWNGLECNDKSKVEEQVARLKEFHSLVPINDLAFSNRHHFEMTSDVLKGFKIWNLAIFNSNVTRFTDELGGPAFVGLEDSLEKLRIYDCFMNEKYKDLFSLSHLRKLKDFLLITTDIRSFGNGYFGDSSESSLQYLSLYRNQIAEIGDRAFANLKMLSHIDMSHNHIKILKRSMFPNPAIYLENLFVGDNPLEVLDKDLFINMPKLDYLQLGGTAVKVMDEAMFKPVWSQLSYCILDVATCEEDDIRWMVKIQEPEGFSIKCIDRNEYLEDILEKMRKEAE